MEEILIVGAGLAGLSAAYELTKKGYTNITIIEQLDRVGGRVLTDTINKLPYDLGGFIILPWYKYFISYCQELDIASQLTLIPDFQEYYYNTSFKKFISLTTTKTPLIEILKLVAHILPLYLRGKLNFYNFNDYSSETAQQFLDRILGKGSVLSQFHNLIFQAYTYPSLDRTPKYSYLKFLLKMSFGYFNKAYILKDGTSILTGKLYERLINSGVKFHFEKKVASIKKNLVETDSGDKFKTDKIIIATTLDNNLFNKILNTNYKFEYTNNYSIFVEMDNQCLIDEELNKKWSVVYLSKSKENGILSFYNLKSINNLHNDNSIGIIMKSDEMRTYGIEELESKLKGYLYNILPNNSIKRIITYTHWQKTMPIVPSAFVKRLNDMQGEDGIYFVGDYIGSSSMETAISSCIKIVKSIK